MIEPTGSRIAVLSDIHANLEAFASVLRDMDDQGVRSVVSLGDVVGYGPDPAPCARLVMEHEIPGVLGNHERGLRSLDCPTNMNPVARDALNRNACMLEEDLAAFLRELPPALERQGCLFVHGCPPADPGRYLYTVPPEELGSLFRTFDHRVCFCGHTHDLRLYSFDGVAVATAKLKQGEIRLDPHKRHIVNVGSVGQPRDGDISAKYVIFDPASLSLDVRFVPYDVEATCEKLERLGFSKSLMVRLRGDVR